MLKLSSALTGRCPKTPVLAGSQVIDSAHSEFTVLDAHKELFFGRLRRPVGSSKHHRHLTKIFAHRPVRLCANHCRLHSAYSVTFSTNRCTETTTWERLKLWRSSCFVTFPAVFQNAGTKSVERGRGPRQNGPPSRAGPGGWIVEVQRHRPGVPFAEELFKCAIWAIRFELDLPFTQARSPYLIA